MKKISQSVLETLIIIIFSNETINASRACNHQRLRIYSFAKLRGYIAAPRATH